MRASARTLSTTMSKVVTQIVGMHAGDSAPAVMVITENSRFLFNVNEGLQRFCMEHRVRLVKVDGIFLTNISTDSVGGLPGMLLTLADLGKKRMTIHGGPGLCDYLRATRHFMRRDDVEVDAYEIPKDSLSSGEAGAAHVSLLPFVRPELSVLPIPVVCGDGASSDSSAAGTADAAASGARTATDSAAADSTADAADAGESRLLFTTVGPFNPLRKFAWPSSASFPGPSFDGAAASSLPRGDDAALLIGTGSAASNPSVPLPFAGANSGVEFTSSLSRLLHVGTVHSPSIAPSLAPSIAPSQVAISYVCSTPDVIGRFHPARAAALGIPPGPLYGRLQKGGSVEATVPIEAALEAGLLSEPGAIAAARATLQAWKQQQKLMVATVTTSAATAVSDDSIAAGEGEHLRVGNVSSIAATGGHTLVSAVSSVVATGERTFVGAVSGEEVHAVTLATATAAVAAAGSQVQQQQQPKQQQRQQQHKRKQKGKGAPSSSNDGADASGGAPSVTATVHPHHVKEPDVPGPLFAIVACPSDAFLQPLTAHPAWQEHYAAEVGAANELLPSNVSDAASVDQIVDEALLAAVVSHAPTARPSPQQCRRVFRGVLQLMYHMAPVTVTSNPAYVLWMARFDPAVQHVLLNHSVDCPLCNHSSSVVALESAAASASAGEAGRAESVPHKDGAVAHLHAESGGVSLWPILHVSQAVQAVKLNVLQPRTFTLPFPLIQCHTAPRVDDIASSSSAVTATAVADASQSSALTPLQQSFLALRRQERRDACAPFSDRVRTVSTGNTAFTSTATTAATLVPAVPAAAPAVGSGFSRGGADWARPRPTVALSGPNIAKHGPNAASSYSAQSTGSVDMAVEGSAASAPAAAKAGPSYDASINPSVACVGGSGAGAAGCDFNASISSGGGGGAGVRIIAEHGVGRVVHAVPLMQRRLLPPQPAASVAAAAHIRDGKVKQQQTAGCVVPSSSIPPFSMLEPLQQLCANEEAAMLTEQLLLSKAVASSSSSQPPPLTTLPDSHHGVVCCCSSMGSEIVCDNDETMAVISAPTRTAPHDQLPVSAAAGQSGGRVQDLPPELAIVFTGTASAVPSKYRNVSGIFVRMPRPALTSSSGNNSNSSSGSGSSSYAANAALDPVRRAHASTSNTSRAMLLDCGEGTYGQLFRRFGPPRQSLSNHSEGSSRIASAASAAANDDCSHGSDNDDDLGLSDIDAALRCLSTVWISHMHADHHLGLPRIIAKRAVAMLGRDGDPLLVIGPSRLLNWLREYSVVDESLNGTWRFVDAEHFKFSPASVAAVASTSSSVAAAPTAAAAAAASSAATSAVAALGSEEELGDGVDCVPLDRYPSKRMRVEASGADETAAAAAVASNIITGQSRGNHGLSINGVFAVPLPLPHQLSQWGNTRAFTAGGNTRASTAGGSTHAATLAEPTFIAATLAGLGVSTLRCVQVVHCAKAYAVRLDVASASSSCSNSNNGGGSAISEPPPPSSSASTSGLAAVWSLVYSGDTRPCSAVVELGRLGAVARPVSTKGAVAAATAESRGGGGGLPVHSPHSLVPSPLAAALSKALHPPSSLSDDTGAVSTAAAAGCTLLIHEATFDDSEEGRIEAAAKKHSTVGEALAVSDAMRARRTILTHFSARYPKLPLLEHNDGGSGGGGGEEEEASESLSPDADCNSSSSIGEMGAFRAATVLGGGNDASSYYRRSVFVAYDLMTIRGADFNELHGLLPVLHALFKDDDPDAVEEAVGILASSGDGTAAY